MSLADQEWIALRDVARVLNVPKWKIYDMIRQGIFTKVDKSGLPYLIHRDDVKRVADNRTTKGLRK